MKTRTEIIFETERLVVVKRHRRSAWCTACLRQVEMLNVDDAAIFARVNSRTIFHWAESGAVHSSETPEGLLLICPHSPNLHP
jgi:hypothetical protein